MVNSNGDFIGSNEKKDQDNHETLDGDEDANELFDILIDDVGGFGRFQIRMLLVSLLASIVTACNHFSPIYLAYTPNFNCTDPRINENLASTTQTGVSNYSTALLLQDQCKFPYKGRNVSCQSFSFETTPFEETIVTDFNLVCDRLSLLPLIASSYMAGVVVINCLAGIASDKWLGRKKTVLVCSLVHILFSFLTAVSGSYEMFVGVRFFVGGTIHATWAAIFVLVVETVPENWRTVTGGFLNFGWNIGSLVMTFSAYFISTWSKLQVTFASFAVGLLAVYFLIPESPRWLLQKGRIEEAKAVLVSIAKTNGVASDVKFHMPSSDFNQHFDQLKKRIRLDMMVKQNDTFVKKFRQSFGAISWRLAIMSVPWLAVGMVAYGIHFSVKLVDFNIFAISALKEVVVIAVILCVVPVFKRFNRLPCIAFQYFISGFFAMIYFMLPESMVSGQVAVFLLCQGLTNGAFCLLDTYNHDVFSTDIRNFAFNFLDSVSKIGTVIAPFIVDLGSLETKSLPMAVFGTVMMAASITFLFTPETKGLPLAQNASDLKHVASFYHKTVVGKLIQKIFR